MFGTRETKPLVIIEEPLSGKNRYAARGNTANKHTNKPYYVFMQRKCVGRRRRKKKYNTCTLEQKSTKKLKNHSVIIKLNKITVETALEK